jgi:serine/threonine-protein kinase
VNAPETTLDRLAGPAARRQRTAGSRRLLTLRVEAIALAALVLAGLGWWTYAGVKASIEAVRATSLRALLDTEIAALDIWVDYSRRDAGRAAAMPALAERAATLVEEPDVENADTLHAELVGVLRATLGPMNAIAANVVARDGRLLATTVDSYRGLRLAPAVVADLAPVFAGAVRFVAPRPERERLVGADRLALTRPIVWFAAPVRDAQGRVIAALQLGKHADVRFHGILGAARLDPSGEAYAFDETGMMLTESRFGDELKRLGLLHADAPGVALRFYVRDPGTPLDAQEDVPADLASRPLTAPVRRAIASRSAPDAAGRSGVLLAPYRNYLGRPTIGAYKWIADYDIGIAVEVDAREAFRPLRYLAVTFWIIFGLLVAATAAALASSFSVLRLRRELRRLGQYRLGEPIGEGGTSTVFRAEHALLKRPTAVKVLKKHLATDEAVARFEREVRLASRLDHPATIEIYDYGRTPDGTFYYAMEYIDGITLADLVARDGPQPVGRTAHILLQVCESLREAHQLGLVHRDIKPANVMLCRRGGEADVVKVLDFGIAKELDPVDDRDLTQHAHVLGTPLYMAPERLRDPADADARADLYAVGVLAYLLLTGRRLFDAPYEAGLIEAILTTPAPRLAAAAPVPIPPALDAVVAACLAKDRAARPANADALIDVLAAVLREHPWTPRDAERWWTAFEGRAPIR